MAAPLQITKTWADLSSRTIENFLPTLYDQVINEVPLFKWLYYKGKVKEYDGGINITVRVKYQTNTTVKSYTGYDKLDVTPTQDTTVAQYAWKSVAGSVSVSGDEMAQNSGEEQIANLLDERLGSLRLDMANELNRQLHLDGTGNTNKDLDGLRRLIPVNVSGAGAQTVGSLNPITEDWWRTISFQFANTNGGATSVGVTRNLGFSNTNASPSLTTAMFRTYNQLTYGGICPDFLITDLNTYGFYQQGESVLKRFSMEDTKAVDAGFRWMYFMGAPLSFDRQISIGYPTNDTTSTNTGGIYFINSNYMHLAVLRGRHFYASPFIVPHDQDAGTAHIFFKGNTIQTQRRVHGLLHYIASFYA